MTDKGKAITACIGIGSIFLLSPAMFTALLVSHVLSGITVACLWDDIKNNRL